MSALASVIYGNRPIGVLLGGLPTAQRIPQPKPVVCALFRRSQEPDSATGDCRMISAVSAFPRSEDYRHD